jgi:hypothetical protein
MDEPILWILAVAVVTAVAMEQWIAWIRSAPTPPHSLTALAVVLGIIGFFRVRLRIRQARNYRQGMRGERAVGQLLEQTRSAGYRVYHDIEADGFNIDHVLIGPGGVFVVETKAISKPAAGKSEITYDGEHVLIDGRLPDRDPVQQARACRDHIGGLLTRITKRRPKLRAVVLYPGWYVRRQPKGVEVWVLNPEAFLSFLDYEATVLPPAEIGLLAEALETHVRARR